MELKEAIEILEYHQRWRKSEESVMVDPVTLTEAIDIILCHVKTNESTYNGNFKGHRNPPKPPLKIDEIKEEDLRDDRI